MSEEAVIVYQQVRTANSESVTLDSVGLYLSLLVSSENESDTELNMPNVQEAGTAFTEFQIVMQNMEQMN